MCVSVCTCVCVLCVLVCVCVSVLYVCVCVRVCVLVCVCQDDAHHVCRESGPMVLIHLEYQREPSDSGLRNSLPENIIHSDTTEQVESRELTEGEIKKMEEREEIKLCTGLFSHSKVHLE